MNNAIARWRKMPHGDKAFFSAVIISTILCFVSVGTGSFVVTRFLSRLFMLHVVNDFSSGYLEILFWTMGITAAQLYKYHMSSMDMYDVINIKGSSRGRKVIHGILQLSLSFLTFVAFLVIVLSIFIELYKWQILSDHDVRIDNIVSHYLPWTDLKWLLWYFVAMDVVILALNRNFCAADNCPEDTKAELNIAASNLKQDIPIALLGVGSEWFIVNLFNHRPYDAPYDYSFGAGIKEMVPVIIILALQFWYAIAEIRRRLNERDIPLPTG